MAFTITFITMNDPASIDDVQQWLTELGEPFEPVGVATLQLRPLPVQIVLSDERPIKAHIDVTPSLPLQRLIDLLFALSLKAGADVQLVGTGSVTRAALWLHLADEQDRLRLHSALEVAAERGNDSVPQQLWEVLAAMSPGQDLRWDQHAAHIVVMKEVGATMGLSLEDANWLSENPHVGDVIPVPAVGQPHLIAWRWLTEAYPGLN